MTDMALLDRLKALPEGNPFKWYQPFEDKFLRDYDKKEDYKQGLEENIEHAEILTPCLAAYQMSAYSYLHPDIRDVVITLCDHKGLWEQFYDIGHEMIITPKGRNLFPKLAVNIRNMNPKVKYYVFVEMEPASDFKFTYKYGKEGWKSVGPADTLYPTRKHYHHDAPVDKPATGEFWMKNTVTFTRLKVTNSPDHKDPPNLPIILHSMQKYRPKISVVIADPLSPCCQNSGAPHNVVCLFSVNHKTVSFPETEFMAVTAYCNDEVKLLKIQENKSAKGHRNKEDQLKAIQPINSHIKLERQKKEVSGTFQQCSQPECVDYEAHARCDATIEWRRQLLQSNPYNQRVDMLVQEQPAQLQCMISAGQEVHSVNYTQLLSEHHFQNPFSTAITHVSNHQPRHFYENVSSIDNWV
ncbi:T-box transcription factor TBX3-like [Watersipora subatra]|uniref:T-box transcription factor TBX3-like n=1 Tax=Watersipora subatra TaxID=2589382 RepID=UPI00355C1F83